MIRIRYQQSRPDPAALSLVVGFLLGPDMKKGSVASDLPTDPDAAADCGGITVTHPSRRRNGAPSAIESRLDDQRNQAA